MKTKCRVLLILLVAAFFTVGNVSAVSEWAIGDQVRLIVTTTNSGTVNVIQSSGSITVRSPCGLLYDAGEFDVQGIVPPGEAVKVDVNWNSTDAAPGMYDIILDGVLSFANEEYGDTNSVVEDAFLLYDPVTMICEVPEVVTDGDISGITMVSDTCYEDGEFIFIVWVNNTGSTLFIPEVVVTFEAEDYDSGPLNHIYCDDPCEPGLNPILHICQLPEDMEAGEYQCSVDMNMHYLDVSIEGPQEIEETYLDCYTCEQTDPDGDTLLYRWVVVPTEWEDDTDIEAYIEDPEKGWYDFGIIMEEAEIWPSPDYGDGYCFRWFYDGEQIVPSPEELVFCEEEVDPNYEPYQIEFLEDSVLSGDITMDDTVYYRFFSDEPLLGIEEETWPWTWEPAYDDESPHKLYVEVRERTDTDIGATDMWAFVYVDTLNQEDPAPLYVWIQNDGEYAFEPEFTFSIPEIDETPTVTLYGDTVLSIAPVGTSVHKLEVDVRDIPPSDEGYYFQLSMDVVQIFEPSLPETLPGALSYRFLIDGYEDNSAEEWIEIQEDYVNAWDWVVPDNDWFATGTHTITVEVTDDLYDHEHSGDGDRIGVATIEVTVSEDDQGGTTDDTDSTDTTGTTEPDVETPPEEEEQEDEAQGFSIRSIIDMILGFFQNLFG